MNEKISGLLDPKIWEMSEEYKEKCRQQLQNYEERLRESPDALMRMLSRSMRFDRKTLRRLFHAVTHHKQVWFDVVIDFRTAPLMRAVSSPRTRTSSASCSTRYITSEHNTRLAIGRTD